MKLFIFLSIFFFAAAITVNAQSTSLKKDTLKVWGECGMCKKTIEKSAKTAGATVANWDTETKMLVIAYDPKKTDNKKIQQAIAGSGYDTRDERASKEAYDKLHECCQYERKPADSASAKKGSH